MPAEIHDQPDGRRHRVRDRRRRTDFAQRRHASWHAGKGPPVLLLHAFPLSSAMWRRQIQALQGEYRVVAPDMRGFGSTPAFTGAPSVDQMADDAAALLDELKIQAPVVVGGLSMGGYVALAFARRHAARLRALILADTRAEADDAAGTRQPR